MTEERVPEEERDEQERATEEPAEKEPLKVSRRQFLVGAGAGTVVGAAAGAGAMSLRRTEAPDVVTPEVAQDAEEEVDEEPVEVQTSELPATQREVTLNIDGQEYDVVVDVRESLWDTMTYTLGLGSRINLGCDRLQCGACGVTVDGRSVNGCAILSARLGRGQEILTVNGITTGPRVEDLHPIQQAYVDNLGFQCAICSRGFIMSTYALLSQNLEPTDEEIRRALEGNICRCGNYAKIMDSVHAAAEAMRASA